MFLPLEKNVIIITIRNGLRFYAIRRQIANEKPTNTEIGLEYTQAACMNMTWKPRAKHWVFKKQKKKNLWKGFPCQPLRS